MTTAIHRGDPPGPAGQSTADACRTPAQNGGGIALKSIEKEGPSAFLFAYRENQKVISLFLETRMKISMEEMVSTFRMVARAAAGPSEPRVTWA